MYGVDNVLISHSSKSIMMKYTFNLIFIRIACHKLKHQTHPNLTWRSKTIFCVRPLNPCFPSCIISQNKLKTSFR